MTKIIQTIFLVLFISLLSTTSSYADNKSEKTRNNIDDLNNINNDQNISTATKTIDVDKNNETNLKQKMKEYRFAISLNGFLDLHYTGGGVDFSFPIYRKGLFEIRNFIGIVGQGDMESEGFGGVSEKISFGFPIKSSKYPVTPYSFMFFDVGYGGERRISTGAFRSLVSYTVGGGAGINISVLKYSTYFVEIGGYATLKVWGENIDKHSSGRISTGFRYMF